LVHQFHLKPIQGWHASKLSHFLIVLCPKCFPDCGLVPWISSKWIQNLRP
jgi:hypothetical protein